MDLLISADHRQVAEVVRRIMGGPGGERIRFGVNAPAAEREVGLRELLDFGLREMSVATSADDQLAAALVTEEAGAAAAAIPVIPAITGLAAGMGGTLLHPVWKPKSETFLNHADLPMRSLALDEDGTLYEVRLADTVQTGQRKLAPYASRVRLKPLTEKVDPWAWSLAICLSAFLSAGSLRTSLELAIDHVSERVQFGQPLATFQGVRNRIADVVILQTGLRELALYTLWAIGARRPSSRIDSLMLRYEQLRVMRETSSWIHQLHGAMGFCYEYPLLQHSLAAQFERQAPLNEPQCLSVLVDHFREIETHYEEAEPAWPLKRADRIVHDRPGRAEVTIAVSTSGGTNGL